MSSMFYNCWRKAMQGPGRTVDVPECAPIQPAPPDFDVGHVVDYDETMRLVARQDEARIEALRERYSPGTLVSLRSHIFRVIGPAEPIFGDPAVELEHCETGLRNFLGVHQVANMPREERGWRVIAHHGRGHLCVDYRPDPVPELVSQLLDAARGEP